MFEIRNTQSTAIRMDSFDQVMETSGTSTMEVYSLNGSCDGLMQTASAWTLVGTGSFTHTADIPMPLPIPIAITIQPNGVQSFYITNTILDAIYSVYYLNGNNQYGAVHASNSDLQLIARGGVGYAFGELGGVPGAGRLWQGAVHYCVFNGPARLHKFVPATGKLLLPIHVNGTIANKTVAPNRNCCPDKCRTAPAGCSSECSVC